MNEIIKEWLMEKVFNERPQQSNDWEVFMNSGEDDSVEGFVLSEEYGLDNAYAIRGMLSNQFSEQVALFEKLNKAKTSKLFTVTCDETKESKEVIVSNSPHGLEIHPIGYSTHSGYAPVTLDFFNTDDAPHAEFNILVWGNIFSEDYTHKVPLEGARHDRAQKEIEKLGFSFGEGFPHQDKLDEYFSLLDGDAPTKESFVEFLNENTEWNICDCCGKIEKSIDLIWITDGVGASCISDEHETHNLLVHEGGFDAVCSDCFLEVAKATKPSLDMILQNLEESNTPFKNGDVVLIDRLDGIPSGTPFTVKAILDKEGEGLCYSVEDRFGEVMSIPVDKVWNPTEYALVLEFCSFAIGTREELTEKLDEFSEITHEGLPELSMAFDTFGHKEEFKEHLLTKGYDVFIEKAFGISMKLDKIESNEKTNYRSVVTDSTEISASTKDELFSLYFREYDNRYKYCNGLCYAIVDEGLKEEFRVWISNIGNYANNGGDMW